MREDDGEVIYIGEKGEEDTYIIHAMRFTGYQSALCFLLIVINRYRGL